MKKFLYLCGMMLLCTDIMAQIDLNDQNWQRVFHDEFTTPGRTWSSYSFLSSDRKWRAYPGNGVTHGNNHMVYQFTNCVFDVSNSQMKLVAEKDNTGRIPNNDYYLPSWMWVSNGGPGYPPSNGLLYFSGDIDARKDSVIGNDMGFRYGYFEIRCKLPVHKGAFPAFWLHAASCETGNSFYESLDIFEYGWHITRPDLYPGSPYTGFKRRFTCGIHFNDSTCVDSTSLFGKVYPIIPDGSSDLDNYHIFSCEWMPDHVIWYFDGVEMNRYDNPAHIPHRNLVLKTSYGIDNYYKYNQQQEGIWQGPGEMLIDYIRVYQLNWDCTTDEVITCQADLNGFDYAVKKSISITSTLGEPVVSSSDKKTFRVTDSFVVTGPFTVNNGAEFTVIKQLCPPDE